MDSLNMDEKHMFSKNNFIMMKPRGGYVFYIHIYNDFIMMICHEDMVMLRSTTDPYGRPVIEVAYEEMILS